ncbi:MAG: hypothetical protein IJR51_09600 [Clostridia bacterium]|nr:hypothetical protein [Clostridia bacterium]MBQ9507395.1 hypothetical protein [Clostridia bacterium]
MQKIIAFLMTIMMFLFPRLNIPENDFDKEAMTTDYTYVFVHGLSGWGEYAAYYKAFPYWGMLGGDLMTYLRARGIDAHGASVSPTASAWDRACELYAQLTGTKTDYGKEHSERCGHDRYGTDYTGRALIDSWSAEDKINILGHSFGGATVLMLVRLMDEGSEAERAVTDENDISPLFTGDKGDWIYSVTTLSAPINGTTAYEVKDEENKLSDVGVTTTFFNTATTPPMDGRVEEDCAAYDMTIDNALKLADTFKALPGVYYFSIPTCLTDEDENGNQVPDTARMESMFTVSSREMGCFTGYTAGGYYVDESWQPNDGLVNTISARAPFNAPQKDFDENDIQPGIWNVMPTYRGDHMSLQGDMLKTNNVRQLYADLITMINGIK